MATYYWVKTSGGSPTSTGTWNASSTANWSTSSGGSPGSGPPTTADDVVFDGSSDNGVAFTVTVSSASCKSLTISPAGNPLDQTLTFPATGSGALTIAGSVYFPSTNFTNSYTGSVTFSSTTTGNTIETNGIKLTNGSANQTFNGVGGEWQLLSALTTTTGATILTNGTLNLNNYTLTTGSLSTGNTNTRVLAFASSGNIVCTGTGTVINYAIADNLTYTGTSKIDCTATPSSGTRNTRTGSTSGQTASNAMNINITGGTDTISFAGNALTADFTGFGGTVANGVMNIYGNVVTSSGMTYSASNSIMSFLASSGTQLLTTAGKTLDFPITQNNSGATLKLQDNLTMGSTRTFTHTSGTLDVNGKTASINTFSSTGTDTRAITFNSGTLSITGTTTSAFTASGSGLTTSAGTGNGTISMTAATAKTFAGGGFSYAAALSQSGAGALTVTGSNTFSGLSNSTQPATITFTAGITTTFTGAVTLAGTSGNLITCNSSSGGTRYTFTFPSGTTTSSLSYCSITDCIGYQNSYWQAYLTNGNVNGGNNLGWLFAPLTYNSSGSQFFT